MSPLTRFLRFNLVGFFGIAVQLCALAPLNRAAPAHFLFTSTLAVELTLLHNFAWHIRYTWPTGSRGNTLTQLLRFHLSNGVVSLIGNLILMRLFVNFTRMPVIVANALTIICCGLVNFLLAHHWVFSRATESTTFALISARNDS